MKAVKNASMSIHQKGLMCLLELLGALSDCGTDDNFEEGSMVLAYGTHEVTVNTGSEPKDVMVSANILVGDTPVCQGDINMVGCAIKPDGFILYADIKTNTAEVCWSVEY